MPPRPKSDSIRYRGPKSVPGARVPEVKADWDAELSRGDCPPEPEPKLGDGVTTPTTVKGCGWARWAEETVRSSPLGTCTWLILTSPVPQWLQNEAKSEFSARHWGQTINGTKCADSPWRSHSKFPIMRQGGQRGKGKASPEGVEALTSLVPLSRGATRARLEITLATH